MVRRSALLMGVLVIAGSAALASGSPGDARAAKLSSAGGAASFERGSGKKARPRVRHNRSKQRRGSRPPVVTPPPGAGAIPGTGALIAQDLATNPNPVPLWKLITAADSTQGAENSRIRQNQHAGIGASSDPHVLINGTTTRTYRRIHVEENDRYSGDVAAGNTSERAQLINNSQTNSFYIARNGDHSIVYLSVRLQAGVPWGRGQAGESQILQFKPAGPGEHFIISMQETDEGLLLRHNYLRDPETLWTGPALKGEWIRLALDIEWAQEGSITVWGDTDGASTELEQLSPTMNVRTLPADGYPQTLSVGMYQDRSAPAHWRDYANIQVATAR